MTCHEGQRHYGVENRRLKDRCEHTLATDKRQEMIENTISGALIIEVKFEDLTSEKLGATVFAECDKVTKVHWELGKARPEFLHRETNFPNLFE
ncbi:hypothetical protein NPIL_47691 [Nephila pilipes]|uniref:Uncharacterized protein n=1 Tax=Nephila pilipes TaxID=299642 RepID=A0A8X6TVF4_NEPPI|nr:hypothetical protein NPIL_47691 [Nephila pilipes]